MIHKPLVAIVITCDRWNTIWKRWIVFLLRLAKKRHHQGGDGAWGKLLVRCHWGAMGGIRVSAPALSPWLQYRKTWRFLSHKYCFASYGRVWTGFRTGSNPTHMAGFNLGLVKKKKKSPSSCQLQLKKENEANGPRCFLTKPTRTLVSKFRPITSLSLWFTIGLGL